MGDKGKGKDGTKDKKKKAVKTGHRPHEERALEGERTNAISPLGTRRTGK